MVQFVPTGDVKQKFFFNVSTPVGAGARGSKPADILLVQFIFLLLQESEIFGHESYKKIRLTGVCDDDLITAIRAFQSLFPDRLTQDGLISRAQGMRFNAGPNWRYWTIVGMNFGLWIRCMPVWPRIDQHPKAQGKLTQIVREALGAV